MDSSTDIKAFLYAFLGKRKITPDYSIRPTGPKHRPRFLCELRAQGFDYVGAGNSTTKKDAQANAANDFVQYLVRQGVMNPGEVPNSSHVNSTVNSSEQISDCNPTRTEVNPCPNSEARGFGNAYHPVATSSSFKSPFNSNRERVDATQEVVEAESVDFNASIHGGWTIENAKSKLHQFFQENHITTDYRYSAIGPDHNKSFVAEMKFYVRQLQRDLSAREAGSNKQTASKSCALSLVRQLYHLKVIGPFLGTLKKSPENKDLEPFALDLRPELEQELDAVISDPSLHLTVKSTEKTEASGPQTLLEERLQPRALELVAPAGTIGFIPWSPPSMNWNPWTASNIDEGYFAVTPLDNISRCLRENYDDRLKNDKVLQRRIQDRETLPIFRVKNVLMEALYENPVVIIRGNTGCGKTTQVCQYILDDYLRSDQGAHCTVVVTQPRRISATSVADRVALERGEELGETAGYSVRFESCLPRPYGSILFCTVGILLRRLEGGLRGISHIIVDEIHERDVNTDFLLVVLRDVILRHPELRVILMSATIDTSLFSRYFGDCPVVEIPGNVHPVTVHYLEDCVEMLRFRPTPDHSKNKNSKEEDKIVGEDDVNLNLKVSEKYSLETRQSMALLSEKDISFELIEALLHYIKRLDIPGAVLIFLPGWNVIFSLLRHLQQSQLAASRQYCFLPLHSMLPREDQRRVFQPVADSTTKVILATNIAESSITIDDVVFVIDSCRAKMKLFTSHNNLTHYATVWAAQNNLEQRRGRAGRVCPGYAFHLCSRARYEKLEKNLTAEMLRSPLHETALSIKLLRLGSISQFLSKALEPPPLDAVIEAEVMLREMKCLDDQEELTALGQLVARIPVEPSLAKMLIVGTLFQQGDAMCILAASDSIQTDVFAMGVDLKRLTYRQRSFAGSRQSDHVALISAFYAYEQVKLEQQYPDAEFNFCEAQSLSLSSLRVLYDARCQLRDILIGFGFPESALVPKVYRTHGTDAELDTVIGLLSIGHYPNVCVHKEKRKVLTTESRAALIHKSSVNCPHKFQELKFPLPFFVFSEKIRTKAVSCKNMSMVTPLHLLLFGSKRIQIMEDDTIRLDNWINLKMNPHTVAKILALRPALDRLILDVSTIPEMVFELSKSQIVQVITNLCHLQAADFQSTGTAPGTKRPSAYSNEPERKFGCYERSPRPSSFAPRRSYGGYRPQGYNSQGHNSQGHNSQGHNPQGYNSQGYDSQGYNSQGYNSQGYSSQRYHPQGYKSQEYNSQGYRPRFPPFQSRGYGPGPRY